MKFQQLRYLVAVSENGLNITAAARQLHTSQPGVSRQLKLLEEELGFQLFEREGRALTRTTAAGEEIISRASSILREMQNIRRTSAELRKADGGTLSIATTHTQARYVLPEVIRAFRGGTVPALDPPAGVSLASRRSGATRSSSGLRRQAHAQEVGRVPDRDVRF